MTDDIGQTAGRYYPGHPLVRHTKDRSLQQLLGDVDRARELLCKQVALRVKERLSLTDAPVVHYRLVQHTACLVIIFGYGLQVPISLDTHAQDIGAICDTIKHRLGDRLDALQS